MDENPDNITNPDDLDSEESASSQQNTTDSLADTRNLFATGLFVRR